MDEQSIKVGIANEGEQLIPISVLEKWTPTNISQFGDTVFFKQDNTYFSMKVLDFRKFFKQ
jgi:hypothetical protein